MPPAPLSVVLKWFDSLLFVFLLRVDWIRVRNDAFAFLKHACIMHSLLHVYVQLYSGNYVEVLWFGAKIVFDSEKRLIGRED